MDLKIFIIQNWHRSTPWLVSEGITRLGASAADINAMIAELMTVR